MAIQLRQARKKIRACLFSIRRLVGVARLLAHATVAETGLHVGSPMRLDQANRNFCYWKLRKQFSNAKVSDLECFLCA
ncbi:MAG: hypothetical protein ACR2PY_03100 [Salinispira sp.]